MKKIVMTAVMLLASGMVSAGTFAPSSTPTPPTTNNMTNTECTMISAASPFKFTPSANVGLGYTCDTTSIAVNGGSTKGKYTYGGSTTSSGGVAVCGGASPVAVSTATGYTVAGPDVTKDGCS